MSARSVYFLCRAEVGSEPAWRGIYPGRRFITPEREKGERKRKRGGSVDAVASLHGVPATLAEFGIE